MVGSGFIRAGCWAHARRKFVAAEGSEPRVARAAVDLIGRMYAIERRIATPDREDDAATHVRKRAEARATESRAVLDEIHDRLLAWHEALLPRSDMAGAVNYALNQWDTLTVFAGDQSVPIDNNRKNSLFVASPEGGRVAAILSSIVSSCRRHDANPELFLTQYFVNRPGNDAEALDEWMPDRWAARQAKLAAEIEWPPQSGGRRGTGIAERSRSKTTSPARLARWSGAPRSRKLQACLGPVPRTASVVVRSTSSRSTEAGGDLRAKATQSPPSTGSSTITPPLAVKNATTCLARASWRPDVAT